MRWKQGLCVFLALAAACCTTAGLAQAAVREPHSPENAVPTVVTSPRSPNDREAPAATQSQQYYAVIYAPQLEAGESIMLGSLDRKLQQEVFVNEKCEALIEPIPPGIYYAHHDTVGTMLFCLHNNASVSFLAGNGWADGELLYLSNLTGDKLS